MNEKILLTSKSNTIHPIPKEHRFPKRWVIGKKVYKTSQLQLTNETIENTFHAILSRVKKQLAHHSQTVFERDYRRDNTENAFAMHAFMNDNIYLYLECDFCYLYQLEYAFFNCSYEAEVREQLNIYSLQGRTKEVALKPDFKTFFQNVLAVQDSRYIIHL